MYLSNSAIGQTIRTAIETDDAATVESIICEGLNPNSTINWLGETSLHFAARYDAVESAKVEGNHFVSYTRWCSFGKVLLRYGASVDGSDSVVLFPFSSPSLGTPLYNAAGSGSVRVMKVRLYHLVLERVSCSM